MKKIHILMIISLLAICACIFCFNSSYASEVENQENNTEQVDSVDIQKEEVLKNIQDCIEAIRQELSYMDKKLNNIKKKNEYENYPAIRLNIDTPMFGLISIANQKLKITSEVSAVDIAKGYSIRDIIKSNSIKVPSFSVASIVVITRDVKLDENITLSDANTAVLKLTEYMNQIKSVNDFLDTQISKIYAGYIKKEKSDKINELKAKLDDLSNKLANIDENLTLIYVLKYNDETLQNYINQYLEYSKNICNFKNILNNVLIEDDELEKTQTNVNDLINSINKLELEVGQYKVTCLENVDLETFFINYRTEIIKIKDDISKYIDNSIENIDSNIDNDDDKNIDNQDEENILDTSDVDQSNILYDVTSKQTLEYMNMTIEYVDDKIKNVLGENILNVINGTFENLPEEVVNKGEVSNIVEEELSKEQKEELVNELANKYKEVISKEYSFYIDNLNLLLNDTQSKVSTISKYTEANVLFDLKYVYLELPNFLEKNLELYNTSICIETKTLTNSIKTELDKLCDVVKNVNKIYKEKKETNEIRGS